MHLRQTRLALHAQPSIHEEARNPTHKQLDCWTSRDALWKWNLEFSIVVGWGSFQSCLGAPSAGEDP